MSRFLEQCLSQRYFSLLLPRYLALLAGLKENDVLGRVPFDCGHMKRWTDLRAVWPDINNVGPIETWARTYEFHCVVCINQQISTEVNWRNKKIRREMSESKKGPNIYMRNVVSTCKAVNTNSMGLVHNLTDGPCRGDFVHLVLRKIAFSL